MNILILLTTLCVSLVTAQYQPTWDSLNSRPLPKWYDQSKFGIFLHWGVYSVPSLVSEWFWDDWKVRNVTTVIEYMKKNYPQGFGYPDFAPMFKAELFNPKAWVELFQKAGARYVVLTSKHIDGFTNWPSKYSWNWNSVDTGPQRDLVGDLAAAIRNYSDIHFGVYYSLYEWFHPLWQEDKANDFKTQYYVEEVMQPQLHEVVETYKPELIWADAYGGEIDTYWKSTEFLAWLYNSSPVKDTVVVNDRWGSGDRCKNGGYFTCHDHYNPGVLEQYKWEDATTLQKSSWGYDRSVGLDGYATTEEIINQLVIVVSCGGNLLLNVGPTHDGRIMPIFEERLLEIGEWLNINGQCIYGSVPWLHQNDTIGPNVWYTSGGNVTGETSTVYAVLLDWPSNSSVLLGALSSHHVTSVEMLGLTETPLKFSSVSDGLQVTLPNLLPSSNLKWAWALKIVVQ
ncbi:alpha-L-fucosidase-like [Dysidea avara]|uniref:alpha-L-fucosidase-like n=1 Tax=Dysidea avara TaxID=196820 RepID=UPI003328937B